MSFFGRPELCRSVKFDTPEGTKSTELSVFFFQKEQTLGAWVRLSGNNASAWNTENVAAIDNSVLLENFARIQFWNSDLSSELKASAEVQASPLGVFVYWTFPENTIEPNWKNLRIKPLPLARDDAETRLELSPLKRICINGPAGSATDVLVFP